MPSVQVRQALCRLLHEELSVSFVETIGFLLQCLKEVSPTAEVEDYVATIIILKVVFDIHDMIIASHQLCKLNLTEWDLTKLDGAGLLGFRKFALV